MCFSYLDGVSVGPVVKLQQCKIAAMNRFVGKLLDYVPKFVRILFEFELGQV